MAGGLFDMARSTFALQEGAFLARPAGNFVPKEGIELVGLSM
jgi:hypothetical protein